MKAPRIQMLWLVYLAGALTAACVAAAAWQFGEGRSALVRQQHLDQRAGMIWYDIDTLKTAAHLGAATGDHRWLLRHEHRRHELHDHMRDTLTGLHGKPAEHLRQAAMAARRLVEAETNALRIAIGTDDEVHAAGLELLLSPDYDAMRSAFGVAMNAALTAARADVAAREKGTSLSLAMAVLCVFAGFGAALARKEAERVAMERANTAKSTFLATMSHELRTPLNVIIGYSELIRDDADDRGDSRLSADVRKIERSARHLLGMVNDILDLSKIEAGKMELSVEAVDARQLVESTADMARPLAMAKGNRFTVSIGPEVQTLHTDNQRLRQCLLNLLSNAAKFTTNGEISLEVTMPIRDGVPVFTAIVRDTGCGISPENAAKLFAPFVQADEGYARKHEGTGLGLVITRNFARAMGGDVTFVSALGAGSTFTLTARDLPERAPVGNARAAVAA